MIATVTLNPSLDEWIHLPTLRHGTLNRGTGFMRYPGGKGINVSRVVHELGGATVAYGLAGGDDGNILLQGLRELGIAFDFVIVRGATRNNYKILTARPRGLTEINAEGPRVAPARFHELARRLLTRSPAPRCVALSGSLPPGAPLTIYRQWIRALRRRGSAVILDASGKALRAGLEARPWLIKPNRPEAEELLCRPLKSRRAFIHAARALLQLGVEYVILSMGRDGALLAGANLPGVWHAQPPAIRVQSAVGAGDSLVAGVAIGWTKHQGMLEAFRLGVACGTATTMTPGTELCHRADVRRLLPRIRVELVG